MKSKMKYVQETSPTSMRDESGTLQLNPIEEQK
jgi:hypothetical protein